MLEQLQKKVSENKTHKSAHAAFECSTDSSDGQEIFTKLTTISIIEGTADAILRNYKSCTIRDLNFNCVCCRSPWWIDTNQRARISNAPVPIWLP